MITTIKIYSDSFKNKIYEVYQNDVFEEKGFIFIDKNGDYFLGYNSKFFELIMEQYAQKKIECTVFFYTTSKNGARAHIGEIVRKTYQHPVLLEVRAMLKKRITNNQKNYNPGKWVKCNDGVNGYWLSTITIIVENFFDKIHKAQNAGLSGIYAFQNACKAGKHDIKYIAIDREI